MTLTDLVRRVPFAVSLRRSMAKRTRQRAVGRVLRQMFDLDGSRTRQLAVALQAFVAPPVAADLAWQSAIECQRALLTADDQLLTSGPPDLSGPFDQGVTVAQACLASKPTRPALLLYLLTRAVKPRTVIELGTNVGISSAYIAAALQTDGVAGRVTTLDASGCRQRVAGQVHRNLSLNNVTYVTGLFAETLATTLRTLAPVDLAFIDGHHECQPTIDYFEQIYLHSSPGAIFVFDDIRWSRGMNEGWRRIQSDRRLSVVVDLWSVGIAVRRRGDSEPHVVLPPIELW